MERAIEAYLSSEDRGFPTAWVLSSELYDDNGDHHINYTYPIATSPSSAIGLLEWTKRSLLNVDQEGE